MPDTISNQISASLPRTYQPKTPLMKQYFQAANDHDGIILLMRVGDFYEAYGPNADKIANVLSITLTSREDGGQRVSMAGVPHHAVERYIARLIKSGFRVAMMDQVEDPKLAKGLVKRRVTRVVSKGTVLEDALLDSNSNNYLVAAVIGDPISGLGVADVSTGEFLTTEMDGENRVDKLIEEIRRLEPAEILLSNCNLDLKERIEEESGITVTLFNPKQTGPRKSAHDVLAGHFGTTSLRGFGCEDFTTGVEAAALALQYLKETQTGDLSHISGISVYSTREFMTLDSVARRNLELTASLSDSGKSRTLLAVIDSTLTPMGGRLLRRRLEEPLLEPELISQRLNAVEEFVNSEILRGDVREHLRGMGDIERLVARVSSAMANARDLIGLRDSLARLPKLIAAIDKCQCSEINRCAYDIGKPNLNMNSIYEVHENPGSRLNTPEEIGKYIQSAIVDEPPVTTREGGLIRPGFSAELDALRASAIEGRTWIANLESQERERTGISSLKVGYNAVFGYFIEITKANLHKTPDNYIRKQTTAGAERYITPELKEYESKVLGADEKAADLEFEIFVQVRSAVSMCSKLLLTVAKALAILDVFSGLAETAFRNRYVRPTVIDDEAIKIRAGRHPVVEQLHSGSQFVPNDCYLDCETDRLHIITGPNMSGKSTALRQVALITLMAQIGSYVPASEAIIGVVDRIFTRVGAHDELATGQSTFMVEMNETSNILNNATRRSLVVLDEIGRGTSTYDGLSIAWAVAEHLNSIGCKTMFATHYHYMNDLEKQMPGVRNFRVSVKEQGDHILWLHKLVPGGTDKSYGIQVARMAGVPPSVISRAQDILRNLERSSSQTTGDVISKGASIETKRQKIQLTLFEMETHPVVDELRNLDISILTPVEALMKLDQLQRNAAETI